MPDEHYEAGEHVPSSLTAHTAPDDLRFTTAVDVYAGYGSQWHVYPVEAVESRSEILTEPPEHLDTDVSLYTLPYEQLR
ncbi:hypothetical protein C499_13025 [Halogeometricum borinquense DSM 11551]|uniref:Uncharacterized protein n=2 Tax=Halogeometricum borinquense TaxID=60847 RepID=E4NUF0_HALBP|nr:hypothetical protein [Halogeometricum borinquense]ADQ68670.1 hypothetical protein Hbor_31350 [Halogeometricum borinquense DSM 11551]ELY25410.1 hypothetical protein C499_13025 [Halogeometricum borinquense DSM 11551]RYJ08623.1 hypothetical protein ELS19_19235 [Halogeometricum borinquense]